MPVQASTNQRAWKESSIRRGGWIIHLSNPADIPHCRQFFSQRSVGDVGFVILICHDSIYREGLLLARERGIRLVLPERYFTDEVDFNIFRYGFGGRTPINGPEENKPGSTFEIERRIIDRDECHEVRESWQDLLTEHFKELTRVHDGWLICEELANNGLVHGFSDSGEVGPVLVRMGCWEDLMWLSVRDSLFKQRWAVVE
jgi:hypothetical protein